MDPKTANHIFIVTVITTTLAVLLQAAPASINHAEVSRTGIPFIDECYLDRECLVTWRTRSKVKLGQLIFEIRQCLNHGSNYKLLSNFYHLTDENLPKFLYELKIIFYQTISLK